VGAAVDEAKLELKADIKQVRTMLEEDYVAESARVTRVEKRLTKTGADLRQHIADSAAHRS
jgi:hypothetical protein